MCEQILCFLDSSHSVCAVPNMTNSFPKSPEIPKSLPQSPGGVCTQPKAERGVGERSICAVFRASNPPLHIFPFPAFARELQSPPGASRHTNLAVVGRRIPWKANTEQQSSPCAPAGWALSGGDSCPNLSGLSFQKWTSWLGNEDTWKHIFVMKMELLLWSFIKPPLY